MHTVLSARAELMEEYKKGEHTSWNLDQEIQTWNKREAILAAGEDVTDEEVLAPAVGNLRQVELGGGSSKLSPIWELKMQL